MTFNPGQTTKTLTVPTLTDSLSEPTGTFQVTLQPPNGVGATRTTAVGTIQDASTAPTLSITDAGAVEGNAGTSPLSLTVTLTPASAQVVTVQFATSDGTATAPQDYQAASGAVTFQAGETSKTIAVQVVGDTTDEPDETLGLTLSSSTGGVTISRAQANGVIRDDDPTPPPTQPQPCAPRPRIVTTQTAGGGKLAVHVQATPKNTQENNVLTEVRFGTFQNARVTLNGQLVTSGQTFIVPATTVAVDFTVERVTPGQSTTVPFVVVDGCGQWPTFVGGGAGAF